MAYPLSDGSELSLQFGRFDEHQRRLRLRLPKIATCWDYAPLIDVTRREPGFDSYHFTGKTASEWMADLRNRRVLDYGNFKQWHKSVVNQSLAVLNRHPRVPDNHYYGLVEYSG